MALGLRAVITRWVGLNIPRAPYQILTLVLASSLPLNLNAQVSSTTKVAASGVSQTKAPKVSTEKRFSGSINLDRTANFYKASDDGGQVANSLTIAPSFKISEKLSLSSVVILSQDDITKNSDWADTLISLTYKTLNLSDSWSLANRIGAIVPTSNKSKKSDLLTGAASTGVSLNYAGAQMSSVSSLSLRFNSHKFTVNNDFSPNVQRVVTARQQFSFQLNSLWSLETDYILRRGYTYRDFERDTFSSSIGLNYQTSKELSLSVGLGNEGSVLKANGKDSNLAFYNENDSTVSGGVTYAF